VTVAFPQFPSLPRRRQYRSLAGAKPMRRIAMLTNPYRIREPTAGGIQTGVARGTRWSMQSRRNRSPVVPTGRARSIQSVPGSLLVQAALDLALHLPFENQPPRKRSVAHSFGELAGDGGADFRLQREPRPLAAI